jgi:hypothetical protein
MTQNRKAELQRKLAMAPVAKPPDGLSDRIKSEIPRQLRFEPERERPHLRQSVAFNLRIAASIVLLASSLYIALHLRSRSDSNTKPGTKPVTMIEERTAAPASGPASVMLPNTPPQPGSARQRQAADQPALPGSPPASVYSAALKDRVAEEKRTERVGMSTGAPANADSVEEPAAAKERITVADNAVPAPAPAAEGGVFAQERTEQFAATAKAAAPAGAFAPPPPAPLARRRDADAAPVRSFDALEEAITRGEAPRNVDVAAIVRHFSAPMNRPSDLSVELEASSAPLDGTKWLLRVSVDAPNLTNTEIALTFGEAVATHRALTGAPAPNETALYEIEFTRSATPDQAIASIHAGEIERVIRVRDLHPWNKASPRMKRASLAAAWARTLQSRTRADAVVAKAREAHIDDLADLAERADRIR